jgi:hypothetical protein
MTVHHADFAIPLPQRLDVTTSSGLSGRAIALGWWVDPESTEDAEHQPTGTLYLVVDSTQPRPVWVPQSELTSSRIVE